MISVLNDCLDVKKAMVILMVPPVLLDADTDTITAALALVPKRSCKHLYTISGSQK